MGQDDALLEAQTDPGRRLFDRGAKFGPGKLVRRTALVSGLTLASRILGYVRESLAAAVFGDKSAINDAFVTAWRVPNLFRSLMGEGAGALMLVLGLLAGSPGMAVPASIVMDRGAKVIYAINVGRGDEVKPPARGIFEIFMRTLEAMVAESIFQDFKRAEADPTVELHHIHIGSLGMLPFYDFIHIDEMFVLGKQAADEYLASTKPKMVAAPLAAMAAPKTVLDAQQYIPPYRR